MTTVRECSFLFKDKWSFYKVNYTLSYNSSLNVPIVYITHTAFSVNYAIKFEISSTKMNKIPHNGKLKSRLQRRIIVEIRKYLERNYNEDPTHENLNGPTKVAFKGKTVALCKRRRI